MTQTLYKLALVSLICQQFCDLMINTVTVFCLFQIDRAIITTFFTGNQTLNESDTVYLTCVANGNPTPSITWIRLSDNSTVKSTLYITSKQDGGGYMCIASNGVGRPDSRIVYIFVQCELLLF